MIQKFVTNLSEQEKKIFYVAVIFVIFAMVDRIFFGPVMDKLKGLDEKINEQKSVIRRDLRLLSYKDHILNESSMYDSYFQQEEQTEEETIAAFLKKIEMLATEAKINLIKVKPTEVQSSKGYIEYFASLECDGPLDQVVSFMHSVDASADLLKIIKVNMSPKRASATEVTSTMVIKKMIIDSSSVLAARKFLQQPEEQRKKVLQQENSGFSGEDKGSDGTKPGGSSGQGGPADTGGGQGKDSGPSVEGTGGRGGPGGPQQSLENSGKNTATWKSQADAGPAYQGQFSQRYQIKGADTGAGEDGDEGQKNGQKNEANPEGYEPIKPSMWEKLLGGN